MRRRLVWLLVGLALVLVAVGAVLTKLPVPAAVSSAAAAAAAVVAGFSTTRAAAVVKLRDDRRDARRSLLRCDRRGRLPLVRELDDPVQLGAHPAAAVGSDRVPAFVRRDVSALAEWAAITADEERCNGRFNARTLYAHDEWLSCMADSGDSSGALEIGRRLLDECRADGDVPLTVLRALRLGISVWAGESGDVAEAVRILHEVGEEDVRRVGEDDPAVRAVDFRLRYWRAVEWARGGRVRDAADEFRRLGDEVVSAFGMSSGLAVKVLRERDKVC
ncbi:MULTISPECIES: hypothetical protein [unclassified Saccharothrix]|uniref:hypothetical protein n=1 Tax=unclassified Saccharothrix TaxID=2593673 RepID=UPI00307EB46C